MNIIDLITELQKIASENGNVPVVNSDDSDVTSVEFNEDGGTPAAVLEFD